MANPSQPPLLELHQVTRTFPGVVALSEVAFDLRAGEVHALVGENGAGKSTLVHLLSGVLQPNQGELCVHGEAVTLSDPVKARQLGIVTAHQEAEFFPPLSVAENMALLTGLPTNSLGLVQWREVNAAAQQAVNQVGEGIRVQQPASGLSVAHRHMTHIANAVVQRASIVILDEPTSALTAQEADWLFAQITRLKQAGAGIIYISHRQDEIFRLADRITVLRDGRKVWTRPCSEVTPDSLVAAMVGREQASTAEPHASKSEASDVRLQVSQLNDRTGRLRNVSFQVHDGEILGIYGLVGAGRTELAETIFGIRQTASGQIQIDGQTQTITSPAKALRAGIGLVPEDRLRQGLFSGLSVRANTIMSTLAQWTRWRFFTNASAERTATASIVQRLSVKHRDLAQPIRQLSGGNQQKIVLGRWLLAQPRVLILDEPTRGVDVGAKAEIHRLLREIANDGCAMLMISSDLTEVLAHADRILVLCEGEVAACLPTATATPETIARAALPNDSPAESDSSTPVHHAPATSHVPSWLARLPSLGGFAWSELGLMAIVLALFLWLGWTSDNFLQAANLANLLGETAFWTLLGLAAATVIIAGGIDISVGSLLGLSAAVAGLILKTDLPAVCAIPLAVVAGIAVGTAGGTLNGWLSLVGRIHPIVVTLGMIFFYRGITIALLRGQQITSLPPAFGALALHRDTGIRGLILVGVGAVVVAYLFLNHTRPGRHLYAVGASPTAARLAGISHAVSWLIAFAISGLLVGIAAVMELSSSMQMQAQLGKGWELQAIAIAVIGGVSITGGRGSVLGVVLGALLLQLVNSALVRWQIQGSQIDLIFGAMILVAVIVDLSWRRLER
ncbi:MAG: hypothetical protein CL681_15980 [Blastopirellula sp.]|nr:hypothetical protein [Blastopirellula sp.]